MDQRIYGTVRPNGTMGIAALLMGRAGLIPTLERLGGLTVANSKGDQCIFETEPPEEAAGPRSERKH
jgi:hypothetical protein